MRFHGTIAGIFAAIFAIVATIHVTKDPSSPFDRSAFAPDVGVIGTEKRSATEREERDALPLPAGLDAPAVAAPMPIELPQRQQGGASAQLGEAFNSEPIDAQWAASAEWRIYRALQVGGVDVVALRVECRTTICRVEATPTPKPATAEESQPFQGRFEIENAFQNAIRPAMSEDPRLDSVMALTLLDRPKADLLTLYVFSTDR